MRAGVDREARHGGRQRALRASRPSPSPSPRPSTADRAHATFSRKRRRDRIMIAERQHAVADDLAAFVALAGDHQHVAGLERRDRTADRLAAVADLACAPGAAARIAARIAAGSSLRGLSSVTMTRSRLLRGDRAHHRPLARVAVAAGAEHHDKLPLDVGPQRLERLRQRVGLVRVIDEDRRAVAVARRDRAGPWRPSSVCQRREDARPARAPVAIASPAATSAFSTWNSPTSGSRN